MANISYLDLKWLQCLQDNHEAFDWVELDESRQKLSWYQMWSVHTFFMACSRSTQTYTMQCVAQLYCQCYCLQELSIPKHLNNWAQIFPVRGKGWGRVIRPSASTCPQPVLYHSALIACGFRSQGRVNGRAHSIKP